MPNNREREIERLQQRVEAITRQSQLFARYNMADIPPPAAPEAAPRFINLDIEADDWVRHNVQERPWAAHDLNLDWAPAARIRREMPRARMPDDWGLRINADPNAFKEVDGKKYGEDYS